MNDLTKTLNLKMREKLVKSDPQFLFTEMVPLVHVEDDVEDEVNFIRLSLPYIKIGQRINKNLLDTQPIMMENLAECLAVGVKKYINKFIAGMFIDKLVHNGYEFPTWGMPPSCRITTAVRWTDEDYSVPLNDISYVLHNTANSYDTMVLSSKAMQSILDSNQFKTIFSMLMKSNGMYSVNGAIKALSQHFQFDIHVYDSIYTDREPDGSIVKKRFLPNNLVLFLSKSDFYNTNSYELANFRLPSKLVGGAEDVGFGPYCYFEDANEETYIAWAVMKVFPRKYNTKSSTTLKIFQDKEEDD